MIGLCYIYYIYTYSLSLSLSLSALMPIVHCGFLSIFIRSGSSVAHFLSLSLFICLLVCLVCLSHCLLSFSLFSKHSSAGPVALAGNLLPVVSSLHTVPM